MAEAARSEEVLEEEEPQSGRAGRGIWSGTLSFGLVSIPVSLHSGTRNTRVALHVLDGEGSPVARRYACSAEDKVIDWRDIVRGYEIRPGEFVVVTDEELESLAPEKSRDIDLRTFVQPEEIDKSLFERPYYLVPDGGSSKAYRLLARSMEDSGLAGIATFVMREREYLVAILADAGVLRVETLRFADRVRTPKQVGLPEKHKIEPAAVARVEKAMEPLAAAALDPKLLVDERERRLMELITRKDEKRHDVVRPHGKPSGEIETVVDLMEKLKKMMGERRRASHPARARRGRVKRSAAAGRATEKGRSAGRRASAG